MTVISPQTRTAIVLFNLGGPDKPEAVRPFLFNLFNDKAIIGAPKLVRYALAKLISSRRAPVARAIYAQIGGKSPILEQTQAQAQALEAALRPHGQVKVFVSMRYWHPFSDEVTRHVKAYDPQHIILLPLYPQFSTATTGSSFTDWQRAVSCDVPQTRLCCYPTHPAFVSAHAALIRPAIENQRAQGKEPRLLFSAHGLPEKTIRKGDPYQWQVEQTVAAVRAELGTVDAVTCYQSRVGPLAWIGPATDAEIERAGREGKAVILIPIAFVSEHSETLVELDIEYRHLAEQSGVAQYIRIPTLSLAPGYIDTLAQLCLAVEPQDRLCSQDKKRLCPQSARQCPYQQEIAA